MDVLQDIAEKRPSEAPEDRHVLDELCRDDPEFLVEGPESDADSALMERLKDFFVVFLDLFSSSY